MNCQVTVTLSEDRNASCDGDVIALPRGSALSGELTLEPSDGPFGIREYEHPHYLAATFAFTFAGRDYRYSDLVSQWNLWAPAGTQVGTECVDFVDQVGQLDGLMDGREDWSYILPDGTMHANSLKYTSCHFWLMVEPSSVLVKCRYYDQNPDIASMVTIFYNRLLEELVLLKSTRLFNDSEGNLEDFHLHGGETVMLQRGQANNLVDHISEPLREPENGHE